MILPWVRPSEIETSTRFCQGFSGRSITEPLLEGGFFAGSGRGRYRDSAIRRIISSQLTLSKGAVLVMFLVLHTHWQAFSPCITRLRLAGEGAGRGFTRDRGGKYLIVTRKQGGL